MSEATKPDKSLTFTIIPESNSSIKPPTENYNDSLLQFRRELMDSLKMNTPAAFVRDLEIAGWTLDWACAAVKANAWSAAGKAEPVTPPWLNLPGCRGGMRDHN